MRHHVTWKRRVYEAGKGLTFAALAPFYSAKPERFAAWMLEALGIATPVYRKRFETLARLMRSLPASGEIAECGVWKGETLFGIAHMVRTSGATRRIFGFDSFSGLPAPTTEDSVNGTYSQKTRKGVFGDTSVELVQNRASKLGFGNITLVKGYFEDTLGGFRDYRFALVHLDVDLYKSYRECLQFFYPLMVSGGYIVFDEYDWTRSYPGAGKAIDEFLSQKTERIRRFEDLGTHARAFIEKI